MAHSSLGQDWWPCLLLDGANPPFGAFVSYDNSTSSGLPASGCKTTTTTATAARHTRRANVCLAAGSCWLLRPASNLVSSAQPYWPPVRKTRQTVQYPARFRPQQAGNVHSAMAAMATAAAAAPAATTLRLHNTPSILAVCLCVRKAS